MKIGEASRRDTRNGGTGLDEARRSELLAKYAGGYGAIVAALDGITDAEIDAREGPDEWSSRQIVHHLADSEMMSATRLRRLLAEDNPVIQGYDQDEFARRLPYDLPIKGALAVFKGVRDVNVPILHRLSHDDWRRSGTHSDTGTYSVETWLEVLSSHAHEHAAQIRRARTGEHTVEPNKNTNRG